MNAKEATGQGGVIFVDGVRGAVHFCIGTCAVDSDHEHVINVEVVDISNREYMLAIPAGLVPKLLKTMARAVNDTPITHEMLKGA